MAPRFAIIDDFLPPALLGAIEGVARERQGELELTDFGGDPQDGAYSALRRMWVLKDGLGALTGQFDAAVMARFGELCRDTGVPEFTVSRLEHELCAQRDGSHFARHIDTDSREPARDLASDRLISAVFYFPCEPHGFSGGELLLHPFFSAGDPVRIAPRRNRLIAFPSFAIHEVTRVTSGDGGFAAARHSVNCWLHRARA